MSTTEGFSDPAPETNGDRFCPATMRDGYGVLWACFLTGRHDGSHAYQRTAGTALPEGHPARGRS